MKKWIFYISFLFFFIPTQTGATTTADYLIVDNFENYTYSNWFQPTDYIVWPDHEVGYWQVGKTGNDFNDPQVWSELKTDITAYNGLDVLSTYRNTNNFYFVGTSTYNYGDIVTLSYKVYIPEPTIAYGEGANLTTWNIFQMFRDNGTGDIVYLDAFAYGGDSKEFGMRIYDDPQYINTTTSGDLHGIGKFNEWNSVYIEFNMVNNRARFYLNGSGFSDWFEWNSGIRFNYIYGFLFRSSAFHSTLHKSEIESQGLRVLEYDDIVINGEPERLAGKTCNIDFDEFATTTFRQINDYSDTNPYSGGFLYTPDSDCTIGKVHAKIQGGDGFDDMVSLRIFRVENKTDNLDWNNYIAGSLPIYADLTGSTLSEFALTNSVRLFEGSHYTFNFVAREHDTLDSGTINIATYNVANTNGDTVVQYTKDNNYKTQLMYNSQFYFEDYAVGVPDLDFTLPCRAIYDTKTTSFESDLYVHGGIGSLDESICTYAVPVSENIDHVDVYGISTGYRDIFTTGKYVLRETVTDFDGNLLFEFESLPVNTGIQKEVNSIIPFGTFLYSKYNEKKVYTYKVCQVEDIDYSGFDYDVAINTGQDPYTIEPRCVTFYIGWNLTDEQTRNMVIDEIGTGETPGDWYELNCNYSLWTVGDYANVLKGVRCALVWAVTPSQNSIQKFYNLRDNILYTVPLGYATWIYNDIKTAVQSTSTDAFNKEIETGKLFGKDGGTTTIEVDNLLRYSYMWEPIERFFNTLMYILFALGLLYWGLRQRL